MVTLYDLLKVGPGQLFPSDPAAHFCARFRLVVFCPFQDEVLVGTLIKADPCATIRLLSILLLTSFRTYSTDCSATSPARSCSRARSRFYLGCELVELAAMLSISTNGTNCAHRNGLRLSVGFFSDVLVPKHALQSGSAWEAEEDGGVWVWSCAGNSFYMDIGEIIRFRVTSVRFNAQPSVSHQVCCPPPCVLTMMGTSAFTQASER